MRPIANVGSSEFLKSLLGEVNDASAAARNAALFFLGFCAYCYVTLTGVDHKDLLLNVQVDLPLLQVKIPQRSFALFVPWLIVVVHFGVMLQHIVLARKVRAIDHRLGHADSRRLLLHSYSYTQAIAGNWGWVVKFATHGITRIPLGLLPTPLLVMFLIIFLPYHDWVITSAQRAALIAHLFVLAIFFSLMRFPDENGTAAKKMRKVRPVAFWLLMISWVLLGVTTIMTVTIPNEGLDRALRWTLPSPLTVPVPVGSDPAKTIRTAFYPTACLFEQPADGHWCAKLKAIVPRPARNLDISDTTVAATGSSGQSTVSLRNRNLQYASFRRADLRNVDFTNSDMANANISHAILSGARLQNVNLVDADLEDAQLDEADLSGAVLDRAKMARATAQGATFGCTSASPPRCASLAKADLRGAILVAADLRRANLEEADLSGSDLRLARLKGAVVAEATIRESNFFHHDILAAEIAFSGQLRGPKGPQADSAGAYTSSWIEIACTDPAANAPVLRELVGRLRPGSGEEYAGLLDRNGFFAALFRDECGAARRILTDGNSQVRSLLEAVRWSAQQRASVAREGRP
jgi:uncharacterized protein YjbI with pentapeptide repeats